MSAWDDPAARIRELEDEVERPRRALTVIRSAFDLDQLDCGRIGLPCADVFSEDRWCLPCRTRAALEGR